MKGVLGWIKAHVAIVVLTLLILVTLPVGWFLSNGWNTSIRTERQKEAEQSLNQVKGFKVTYTVPAVLPGESPISLTAAPNDLLTEEFRQLRDERIAQVREVAAQAERLNERDGRDLLIDGLFPRASSGNAERIRAIELRKRVLISPTGSQVYDELLGRYGAGAPTPANLVAEMLGEMRSQFMETWISNNGNVQLDAEAQESLRERLVGARIGEYKRRGRELSVYFSTEEIPETLAPRVEPPKPPTIDECYQWQFGFWVVEDVLGMIAEVNRGSDSVEDAVVKRIAELYTDGLVLAPGTEAPGSPDFSRSITGRTGSTSLYDLVTVDLSLIVSSERLPEIFDAVQRYGFASVRGVDITEADVWGDLAEGYSYGTEHVVRLDMTLELIYLRAWTTPTMPDSVKNALGIAAEGSTPDAEEPG